MVRRPGILEYLPTHSKRGVYKDGHEQKDVVEYRQQFVAEMRELEATHLPPPAHGITTGDEMDRARELVKAEDRLVEKKRVTITQDETTIHPNDDQRYAWQKAGTIRAGKAVIRKSLRQKYHEALQTGAGRNLRPRQRRSTKNRDSTQGSRPHGHPYPQGIIII